MSTPSDPAPVQEELDLGLPPLPAEKEETPPVGFLRRPLTRRRAGGSILALAGMALVLQVGLVAHDLGERQTSIQPLMLASQNESDISLAERVFLQASPSVVAIGVTDGGSGSGFFYAPGRIATNAHVVTSLPLTGEVVTSAVGSIVIVELADGRRRDGKVTHVDTRMDVAIVSVEDADDVPALAFADTNETRHGQRVVAIGNPLGLVASVSEGIISSPQRTTVFREDPVQSQLVQTDAAVNPGNSGGPLLDDEGRVVGIVTIRPDSEGGRTITGVSFALPSNAVQASLTELEEDGEVKYVLIGVTGRTANLDDGETPGMLVEDLTPGGAADLAGVETGDVITRLDEDTIEDFEDLTSSLYGREPGEVVPLEVERGSDTLTLEITLQDRPLGS